MNSVRKSVAISFATRYTEIALQFLTTIIVARLLTPREIGIFSVAMVLISLAHALRAFGVDQYIIQERDLTPDKIRSAFGVSIILSWSVSGLIVLVSQPMADFYRQPGVHDVLLVLAINFFLLPFGSITMAYLRREMQFGTLYRVRAFSTLVGALTVTALALSGFGYMSMAWAAVAGLVASIIALGFCRPKELPYLPHVRGFRQVLKFGGYMSATTALKGLGRGAPELVIGRALSMDAVGLFGRAAGLVQIFNRAITSAILPVVLPHFSAKHREGQPIKEAYLRAMACLTGLAWPFFAFLAALAYPVIRVLYGNQWDASIPLVRVLCLDGAVFVGIVACTEIFVAVGRVNVTVKVELMYQATKVALIIVAVPFGLSAVAIVMVAATSIGLLVVYRYMKVLLGISLLDYFQATFRSIIVAGVSAVVPMAIVLNYNVRSGSVLSWLLVSVFGFMISWFWAVYVIRHPLRDEVSGGWLWMKGVVLRQRDT